MKLKLSSACSILIAFIVTIGFVNADLLTDFTRNTYLLDADVPEVTTSLQSGQQGIDWAYSPIGLIQLAKFEDDLYSQFGSHSRKQKLFYEIGPKGSEFDEFLRWWIHDNKTTSGKSTQYLPASKRISSISAHPFLTLRMIKRFSRLAEFLNGRNDIRAYADEIQDLQQHKSLKFKPNFFQKLKAFDARTKLPTYRDVRNVLRSILTIRYYYDLNVDQLIDGKLSDISTNSGISLEEAFEIGYFAYKQRMFTESLEWLQSVLERITSYPGSTSLTSENVLGLIVEVSKEHDTLIDEIIQRKSEDVYHRFTHKITSGKTLITRRSTERAEFIESKNKLNASNPLPAYELLCAGRDFVPEAQRVKLTCWYEQHLDTAWLINPLKVESHSHDPFVVQIYNVATNKLMDYLLSAAIPNMERATAIPNDKRGKGHNESVKYQASSSVSLLVEDKEDRKVLGPLSRRIGRMTQLAPSNPIDPTLTATEPWQIGAYAFGGESTLHFDALAGSEAVDSRGYRVATFMIYLNNVRRGGYTAFPYLGISIVPKKGSALFWHNLNRYGTIDQRTLHGGCPVILGEKWIATKFIRQSH